LPESLIHPDDAEGWVREHGDGADAGAVLAFFDRLPAMDVGELTGRWRGSGLSTGSPLDGLLEAYGWYGKEFLDPETVHPLLVADRSGRPRPVDPALIPLSLVRNHAGFVHHRLVRTAFRGVRPLVFTRRPTARLRAVEHRGVLTAAMVYDALPIIDVFRRVSADTVLGLMDMRGLTDPFFFVLRRDPLRPVPRGAPP
jgi:hypothetical protein